MGHVLGLMVLCFPPQMQWINSVYIIFKIVGGEQKLLQIVGRLRFLLRSTPLKWVLLHSVVCHHHTIIENWNLYSTKSGWDNINCYWFCGSWKRFNEWPSSLRLADDFWRAIFRSKGFTTNLFIECKSLSIKQWH